MRSRTLSSAASFVLAVTALGGVTIPVGAAVAAPPAVHERWTERWRSVAELAAQQGGRA